MDKGKNWNIKKFEICKSDGLYLCFDCNSYFCDECFKYVHNQKINSNHNKENIDLFFPIDIKCQKHPEYPMHLFCLDEKGKLKNIIINYYYITSLCIMIF